MRSLELVVFGVLLAFAIGAVGVGAAVVTEGVGNSRTQVGIGAFIALFGVFGAASLGNAELRCRRLCGSWPFRGS